MSGDVTGWICERDFNISERVTVSMPTVRTNDIETYYERRGEGRPVVFVHAAMLDHSMWDEQVEALVPDYETVVYDLRGHGRTGGSDETEYSVELYGEDLAALVAELDLDRPVVCGLSLGGMIALTYAARHPDRLAGLVVADAGAPGYQTRGEQFLFEVGYRVVVPPVRLLGIERVERVTVWLAERLQRGSGGDYEGVERIRENGPTVTTDEFAKVLGSMRRYRESEVDLAAVSVPTLVLSGENELRFNRLHAAALGERLADVAVEEVPDAGHASNLDNPEYFSNALAEFLWRVVASGADDDMDGRAEPRVQ